MKITNLRPTEVGTAVRIAADSAATELDALVASGMGTWTNIGNGVQMYRGRLGNYHVMQLGHNLWSATVNGYSIGTGSTEADAKALVAAREA